MDLPSLHTMLLLKLPSLDLHNVLFTILVSHTALFLMEELTSRLEKCDLGPTLTEPTGLNVSHNPEAASLTDGMANELTAV